ncbi:MAG: hypothetical protein D3909_05425 [Candidatus Electrothrix sp. ATG1]|nr:hypothetical protein [Candidatus Electrothrix sp. ATG1]
MTSYFSFLNITPEILKQKMINRHCIRIINRTITTICSILCTLLLLHFFVADLPAAETNVRAASTLNIYATGLSLKGAYTAQKKYVSALIPQYGQPIGYKIGFTGKALQERFQVSKPASGILLDKMLLPDGASFSLASALHPMLDPDLKKKSLPDGVSFSLTSTYRPMIEPDIIVTVKDQGIMTARNELEVANHLDEVRPFLELPVIPFPEGTKLTGTTLVACNIAARAGVSGKGRKIAVSPAFVQTFAHMETILTDETGTILQNTPGSNLLGHPLRAVLWLIKELRARGESLQAGQLISLGGFGKLFPLKEPGKTYTLTYMGLPGGPLSTSVRISE